MPLLHPITLKPFLAACAPRNVEGRTLQIYSRFTLSMAAKLTYGARLGCSYDLFIFYAYIEVMSLLQGIASC